MMENIMGLANIPLVFPISRHHKSLTQHLLMFPQRSRPLKR